MELHYDQSRDSLDLHSLVPNSYNMLSASGLAGKIVCVRKSGAQAATSYLRKEACNATLDILLERAMLSERQSAEWV